jgi:hypothetical protein
MTHAYNLLITRNLLPTNTYRWARWRLAQVPYALITRVSSLTHWYLFLRPKMITTKSQCERN